jgi:pyruvate/2-oxoglutarate dehydrogenase complex dihydrolipoamide acyltransferase (E2) component
MEAGAATAPPPALAAYATPVAPSVPAPLPAPLESALDVRALARLGLPDDLTQAASATSVPIGADPASWLLGLFEQMPAAEHLPRGQGSVIVVAGGREAALELARQLAEELGLDPEALLIASPTYRSRAIPAHRRLEAADAAAEARRSWRRRPRPTIVAVEAAPGRRGDWARRVIDALEPTMVWGAVEATRKPEDVFEWAEELGGFDALGVTDLDGTVSPAAVLQCGIPIGRLDGRPATPLLWASLLAPRLAA